MIKQEFCKKKHLFIDMDGVVAGISHLPKNGDGEVDFINDFSFESLLPVKPVIDHLIDLSKGGVKLYILSAIPNSESMAQKNNWLDLNFNVAQSNRYFVNSSKNKAITLDQLIESLGLEKDESLLVDDTRSILDDCRYRGIDSLHPSEFLALMYV